MKAEIYDQQEIMKRRKPRGVEDIKSDFCKKIHLATDLVNETVDITFCAKQSMEILLPLQQQLRSTHSSPCAGKAAHVLGILYHSHSSGLKESMIHTEKAR